MTEATMLSSRAAFGIAAGVCGTLFLGYCLYFDYKRHKDPQFKQKLRDRRRAKKEAAQPGRRGGAGGTDFPNMKDHEAVQRFFLQEVQLGEELLAAGDLENGVDHLGNAVAVCSQPNDLLQVLQQTLQPPVFHLLIQRLPQIAPRVAAHEKRQAQQEKQHQMQEDDVE